jgi:hypothetical protein
VNINYDNRCYVYDTSKPNLPLILSGTRYDETRLPMADIVTNGPTYHELIKMLSKVSSPGNINTAVNPLPLNQKLITSDGKSQGCEQDDHNNATIEQPQLSNMNNDDYLNNKKDYEQYFEPTQKQPLLYDKRDEVQVELDSNYDQ